LVIYHQNYLFTVSFDDKEKNIVKKKEYSSLFLPEKKTFSSKVHEDEGEHSDYSVLRV